MNGVALMSQVSQMSALKTGLALHKQNAMTLLDSMSNVNRVGAARTHAKIEPIVPILHSLGGAIRGNNIDIRI
ncbi:MAG: hypothetical protein GF333_03405 [Candidatus Omnitrophica bacterium]|nr:hypothetical protein [Candidatus Omnitrophota bacterium]